MQWKEAYPFEFYGNSKKTERTTWPGFPILEKRQWNKSSVKGKRANLKTGVSRKQSTPNFPKNEHFLPPDTHISRAKKYSFFAKFDKLCYRRNTRVKRNNKIQKNRPVKVTVRDPSTKLNHLSKVNWDGKIITRVHQVY